MPAFTVLVHTSNDALRLGRTLEMLLPCSEMVIVDHHSSDATRRIAGEYGARVLTAGSSSSFEHYLEFASNGWCFCIQPGESISENLQTSLFEWTLLPPEAVAGRTYSVFLREQSSGDTWNRLPEAEVRLVERSCSRWRGNLPSSAPSSIVLEGDLLRFANP